MVQFRNKVCEMTAVMVEILMNMGLIFNQPKQTNNL